jgi:hypothetical protein
MGSRGRAGYGRRMEEEPRDEITEQPDSPEDPEATEPAGEGDEHSDAPGETGTGGREGDPEKGKPYRR